MANNENEIEKFLDENFELIEELLCPPDMALIYFVTDDLDEPNRKKIEKHISECDECKKTVDDLRKASEWFDSKQAEVFHHLEQRAVSEQLLPWFGFHLPDYLMLAYLEGKIPNDQKGIKVKADIEKHLEQCNICQTKIQEYMNIKWTIINMADRQKIVYQTQLLRDVALKLQQLALAYVRQKRAHRVIRQRSGMVEDQQITAKVVDQSGNLLLDNEGRAITTKFNVVNASIDNTGLLKIELGAVDQSYWEQTDKKYEVEVRVEYENVKIILPKSYINSQGRVIITSDLKISKIGVSFIPLKNINISVISN